MAARINHRFNYPELSYDTEPNFQPCIKVSVFFKKLHSVSYEAFFEHWQTVHADLAAATDVFRSNVLRYVQVRPFFFFFFFFFTLFNSLSLDTNYRHVGMLQHHQTPEMKARAQSLGENTLDYDACAQIWVRTWDDWMKFYTSEEYAASLNEDCDRFMALPMTYMVGQENLVVGDASRWIGGNDGLRLHAPKLSKSYS